MPTQSNSDFSLSVLDDIEYLVRRRFPGSRSPPPINSGADAHEAWKQTEKNRASYRTELLAMPPTDRAALVSREREADTQAYIAKAEAEERARNFNKPHAMADFDYWSKCAHWTLDEAIALSFGRSPEVVSWDNVHHYASVSRFARDYSLRRDLALRALRWNQLYDPVLPGIFLAWAKRTDIEVPAALIAKVEARGVMVADWKSLFDKSQEAGQSLSDALDNMTSAHDTLRKRVAQLETEAAAAAQLRAMVADRDEEIAALNARLAAHWPWGNHDTALLQHLAAAADRFWKRYDPTDSTTAPTNKQVKEWLTERGVADRVAEIMAQILRPDGLPVGPRT
jgi:hypothetical protein